MSESNVVQFMYTAYSSMYVSRCYVQCSESLVRTVAKISLKGLCLEFRCSNTVFTSGISIYIEVNLLSKLQQKYWYTHTKHTTQTHSQCMRPHGRDLASHLKAYIRGRSRRPHLQRIKHSKWANKYVNTAFFF